MANEYVRKEWNGGVVRSTLNGAIAAATTTLILADGSTFPAGASPFVLVLDRGTAAEEKVLVAGGRIGNTLSGVQRAYDGSTAQDHASGAYVEHVLDAFTVDQMNALATKMTTAGDIVYKTTTGDNTAFSRLALGSSGLPLVAGASAPQYAQLGTAGIADDAVTAAKILAGAVGTAELATSAVTSDKIADFNVTSGKINNSAVGTNQLADAGVTLAKMALLTNGNVITGQASSNTSVPGYSSGTIANRPAGGEGMLYYANDEDKIYLYEGAGWKLYRYGETNFSPTLTGMAIGTGGSASNILTYRYEDGILTGVGQIIFGTAGTTFPGATITITLPTGFSFSAPAGTTPVGEAVYSIASTNYKGTCWVATGTTMRFVVENVAGTYPTLIATSTTVPATWAAGSAIYYNFATPAIFT